MEQPNQFDVARPLCEQIWREYKKVLGSKHPQTLKAAEHVADCYSKLGVLDRAAELYRKILSHKQNLFTVAKLAGITRGSGDANAPGTITKTLFRQNYVRNITRRVSYKGRLVDRMPTDVPSGAEKLIIITDIGHDNDG